MRIRIGFRWAAYFTVILLLAGCMTTLGVVGKVLTVGMFPDSEYIVLPTSVSDIDKQQRIYEENARKVLKDSYGTFYFDPDSNGSGVTTMANDELPVLRSVFSKGKGLVTPLMVVDSGGRKVPDWGETERMIVKMRQTMKLNIVSVDLCKKVWERIQATRKESIQRGGLMGSNNKLLSNSTYDLVFKHFEGQFDYIIFDDIAADNVFFADGDIFQGYPGGQKLAWAYFKFATFDYFKALSKGGSYKHYSLCGKFLIDQYKANINFKKPVVLKGVGAKKFSKEVIELKLDMVAACGDGFRAIGMEGFTQSRRLK